MSLIAKQLARREKNCALTKAKFWKGIGETRKRRIWVLAALINRHVEHNVIIPLDN